MPTFNSNIRKGFLDGRVVNMYVARNRYNKGNQSRGFETRFIEFILKLAFIGSRITSPWFGFEFYRQGITLEQAPSPGNSWQDFCLNFYFFFSGFPGSECFAVKQKNTTQYITPGSTSDNGLYGDAPPDGATFTGQRYIYKGKENYHYMFNLKGSNG